MSKAKNENGYALIIVLALITVVTILMFSYLNTFYYDTRETEIENLKNQNNYLLESAVEITKAIVEENNINTEDDLEEIVDLIELNSTSLFNERIITSINQGANIITYMTNTGLFNSRADSKISFTYKDFDTDIFDLHKIIISDKTDPDKSIKGNHSFRSSFSPSDVYIISDDLFNEYIQEKLIKFQEGFIVSSQDHYYDQLYLSLEDDFYLNSLLVNGEAELEGEGSNRPDLVINQDVYIAGDFQLSKFSKIIINGDLIVYNGDLDFNNIDMIEIGGNLIVSGDVKITGTPRIKLGNLSADTIQIESGNSDVFTD